MAANNPVPQGTINRLRASVVVAAFPSLAVTSPFLGKEGIRLGFQGATTSRLPTMTGVVTSPEPYMDAEVTMYTLKTNGLAALWRAQLELNSVIGDISVYPDTQGLPNYNFSNCSINSIGEMSFAGEDPVMAVTVGGIYYINSSLFTSN